MEPPAPGQKRHRPTRDEDYTPVRCTICSKLLLSRRTFHRHKASCIDRRSAEYKQAQGQSGTQLPPIEEDQHLLEELPPAGEQQEEDVAAGDNELDDIPCDPQCEPPVSSDGHPELGSHGMEDESTDEEEEDGGEQGLPLGHHGSTADQPHGEPVVHHGEPDFGNPDVGHGQPQEGEDGGGQEIDNVLHQGMGAGEVDGVHGFLLEDEEEEGLHGAFGSDASDDEEEPLSLHTSGADRWEEFVESAGADAPGEHPCEAPTEDQRDARFYLRHLLTPLYPGSKLSVIGACYVLASEKVEGRMSDKCVDRMCRYMADCALPEGNLHPPSLYLLKKCLQVDTADMFEEHVCVNDCHRFPKLSRSQFQAHMDEKCPHCEHPRFQVVELSSGVVIKPYKVFWDLGLARTLQESFFCMPEFCEQRSTGRDKYDTDFYQSEEAARLDARVGGALMKIDNSAWEFGMDFFQPFTFKTHSTGVVCIR